LGEALKNLISHILDPKKCRTEWKEFAELLASSSALSETKDVLPFFKNRNNLSLLLSSYIPMIKAADRVAHEYEIYGDFVADLIVGDSSCHRYLLVEFENGAADSVFKWKGKKSTPDWARRFEGAYSQLVDWLWKLEDMRSTNKAITLTG
jgi:hypothetical protein